MQRKKTPRKHIELSTVLFTKWKINDSFDSFSQVLPFVEFL